MKTLDQFTNLYSVSKTLRFELQPIGDTLKNFEHSMILMEDEHRAESYKVVKKIIDSYHKMFIDNSLNRAKLSPQHSIFQETLGLFAERYNKNNRSEEDKKELDNLRKQLRGIIVYFLTGKNGKLTDKNQQEQYKLLFGKELIEKILPEQNGMSEEELSRLSEFKGYTTYFTGFNENRKNLYSPEAKSTAISYRLIHDNLPMFIDNMNTYRKIKDKLSEEIAAVGKLFAENGYLEKESLDEVFSLDYFTHVFTQRGIERYNAYINKIVCKDDQSELKGLNERINLYNQKQKDKKDKLPLFKALKKQILSDREKLSWIPEKFQNDQELLSAVNDYCKHIQRGILNRTKKLLTSLDKYDLTQIFVLNEEKYLSTIALRVCGDCNAINKAREKAYDLVHTPKKWTKTYEEKRKKALKQEKSMSISALDESIVNLTIEGNALGNTVISNYFSSLGRKEHTDGSIDPDFITDIEKKYNEAKILLTSKYPVKRSLITNEGDVEVIKNLLDSISSLQRFIKPLSGWGDEPLKDERFYAELTTIRETLDQIIPLYNMVRNYVTRKPYSNDKIKLNFQNKQLLNGWDKNKESDNCAVILSKDNYYYLGIIDNKHKKIFEKSNYNAQNHEYYNKAEFKLVSKGLTGTVSKCTVKLNSVQAHFNSNNGTETEPYVLYDSKTFNGELLITRELFDLYYTEYGKESPYKKFQKQYFVDNPDKEAEYVEAVEMWIAFCLEFLKKYKSMESFDLSSLLPAHEYESVNEFYNQADKLLYRAWFSQVPADYIDSLVAEGKLYLFRIYNKDFSKSSKGMPNLHTLYWKMLFDEQNLVDANYKIAGGAKVFYRRKSLKKVHPSHPANMPIHKKKPNNKGKVSIFSYDLTKDKRYTMDKFMLNVPIKMNSGGEKNNDLNMMVQEYIRSNPDVHIIGIDRGERNLLYITVIDRNGKLVEQSSLNVIENTYKNTEYKTDYHDLLEERSAKRLEERKSWKSIEGIKELKQGYLSQAVHKITELMLKYNAIVVLEDLNAGFVRGRQKVETSIYRQFEKQLTDKLNYFVDKKRDANEPGGLRNALQLTNPCKALEDLQGQNGFLFYVPAGYTTKIDPITGFVSFLDTRYENVTKAKDFFSKFDAIKYNQNDRRFEISFDYNKFTEKAKGTHTQWTLCTHGTRIKSYRNTLNNKWWCHEEVNLTEAFTQFFEHYGIKTQSTEDLKPFIMKQDSKDFFLGLYSLLKLTLQMRNSRKETGEDYIISPIADSHGDFYDSRLCSKDLPQDADANGAYNIALKGLYILQKIQNSDTFTKDTLKISNKDWLCFVQNKPYRHD